MGNALFKCFIMIFLIALGFVLKKIGIFKQEDSKVLSKIMMYITLPALVINAFRNFELDPRLLYFIFLAIVTNGIMSVVGWRLGKKETPEANAMYVMSLNGYNIGSFCIPFVSNIFPTQVVDVVMFDIGNALMNCGSVYSCAMMLLQPDSKFSLKKILKKLFTSFPFDMYIVIFTLSLLHVNFPDRVYEVATTVAGANTPCVMLMLGMLFEIRLTKDARRQVLEIITVRTICELAFAAVALFVLPLPFELRRVAAMLVCAPISSMTAIFCATFDCDPDVYGTVTSLSIPISIALMMGLALL